MGVGRPGIGRKEQAAAPPEVNKWIDEEQRRRGERDRAVIVRELIVAGHQALVQVGAQ